MEKKKPLQNNSLKTNKSPISQKYPRLKKKKKSKKIPSLRKGFHQKSVALYSSKLSYILSETKLMRPQVKVRVTVVTHVPSCVKRFGTGLRLKDKRWEDSIREWISLEFAESQRAVENRGKWRKLVAKSSVVPQRPSWFRDR